MPQRAIDETTKTKRTAERKKTTTRTKRRFITARIGAMRLLARAPLGAPSGRRSGAMRAAHANPLNSPKSQTTRRPSDSPFDRNSSLSSRQQFASMRKDNSSELANRKEAIYLSADFVRFPPTSLRVSLGLPASSGLASWEAHLSDFRIQSRLVEVELVKSGEKSARKERDKKSVQLDFSRTTTKTNNRTHKEAAADISAGTIRLIE